MFSRRLFTTSACLTLLAGCASAKTDHRSASLQAHCQALEAKAQGRLGVSIVDTATGQQWGWREDERFMMLSSFKLLASALVLHRVDQGQESLQRRMAYPRSALIPGADAGRAVRGHHHHQRQHSRQSDSGKLRWPCSADRLCAPAGGRGYTAGPQ